MLANIEDLLLGLVHDLGHRAALGVESRGGDLITGGHQFAQNRAVAHDFGVTANIAGAGHVLGQRVEVAQAPHFVGAALALQVLKHGNDVGWTVGINQGANGGINQAVLVTVKVAISQDVAHPVPGLVAQQEAANHAGLALNRVRRNAQLRDLAVWHVIFRDGNIVLHRCSCIAT